MVALGGELFLMSEVSLHIGLLSGKVNKPPLDDTSNPTATEGPSWGYLRCVLGASVRVCQLLAVKCPGFLKYVRKLTFEYPQEGPGVADNP